MLRSCDYRPWTLATRNLNHIAAPPLLRHYPHAAMVSAVWHAFVDSRVYRYPHHLTGTIRDEKPAQGYLSPIPRVPAED